MNHMKIKQALKILKHHNDWRRNNSDIDMEMVNPKLLGKAIDTVITFTETITQLTEVKL